MGSHQNKNVSAQQRKQSEETAYRMGENLCQLFIQQGLNIRICKELKT
jgi:hypothetical protein